MTEKRVFYILFFMQSFHLFLDSLGISRFVDWFLSVDPFLWIAVLNLVLIAVAVGWFFCRVR